MVQKKLPLINSAHGSETRNIINELIKLFNGMGYTYDEALSQAHVILKKAQQTNDMNKDVQAQVNKFISEFESTGETNLEIVQARGDYDVLSDRITDLTTTQEYKSEKHTPKNLTLSANGDNRRSFIVFTDDDGFSEYYDYIAPTLEAKGFVGNPAIITSTIGTSGRMTIEQLRDLQNRGHEILSHTQDHLMFHQLTSDEVERQCKLSKETLINWGLKVDNIIYPGGNDGGSDGINRIKKYYRSGWRSSSGVANEMYRTLDEGYTMWRVSIDGNTLSHLKQQVDKCKETGSLLVLMTHANIQDAERKKRFSDIVDYIYNQQIDVGTMTEALDIFGNTFDIGHRKTMKVLAGGEVIGNAFASAFKSRFEGFDISDKSVPNSFEKEKITYSMFNHVDKDHANFPENHIGILETFVSGSNVSQSYQYWRPTRSNNVYYRYVDGTIAEGVWGDWNTRGLQLKNNLPEDINHSDIPQNITLSEVSTADGYSDVGTLLTLKTKESSSFTKQLFFPLNKNELYYRTYNSSGTVEEFIKVPKVKSKDFLIDTVVFSIGEVKKVIDVDITDLVGSAVATNSLSYTLITKSAQMDRLMFNSRIQNGILKIHFFNPTPDATTQVYMPLFKITVFE